MFNLNLSLSPSLQVFRMVDLRIQQISFGPSLLPIAIGMVPLLDLRFTVTLGGVCWFVVSQAVFSFVSQARTTETLLAGYG